MILYGSPMSPFVRKVLFCAAFKGIELDIRGARDSGEAFAAVSPFRKMPALVDDDFSISDSSAIVAYLEDHGPALIPADTRGRARAVWFDEFADTMLIPCITKMFWQRFVRPTLMGETGDLELAAQAEKDELPPLLVYLESVAPLEGFLLGAEPSLADIAVIGALHNYIGYCAPALDAALYPRTTALVARFDAHPAFAAVLEREVHAKAAMQRQAA